jgi:hypothetical protein
MKVKIDYFYFICSKINYIFSMSANKKDDTLKIKSGKNGLIKFLKKKK